MRRAWALIVLSMALVATARAHHVAARQHAGRQLQLSGVVQDYQWTNPKVELHLAVTGPARVAGEWHLAGAPVLQMVRYGWARDSLRPGDRVVVDCRRFSGGGRSGRILAIRRADDVAASPVPGPVPDY